MSAKVFIDGAAGTTGIEIAERLGERDDVQLIILSDDDRKNDDARRGAIIAADVAILCLPDAAAKEAVAMADAQNPTKFIDASTAHRIDPNWTYGFAEMRMGQQQAIENAQFVSNPGCYPTGFLGLIAPLVDAGLLPKNLPYNVNAVSGYSGGGKELIAHFESAGNIAFRGYALAHGHKHLPEMQLHAGLNHAPIFAPAVINAYRGMVVEIMVPLGAFNIKSTPQEMHDALVSHYAGSKLVNVHEGDMPSEILLLNGDDGNDGMTLYVAPSADGAQLRLIATLDNLGKGASGAAVQNLNLMIGANIYEGLRLA
ncbi:N-acetyl-gamma-glutamyl-phosphate reductase [Sphingorhabdus lutea]|uniref:N-acetyl-gamma-glutamyl-phosphate reductase n=1 Tax=Sphingorhabdus lutea TaxID=1913578 RepID=A0A1L3JD62_9SPHN|nr:N-acetyl-gamma-glutamyl-phosphate reductase [Sphingorhabdus lutea]APG63097.1 N-acetyl-gamma-glutamyl-phosphate reductase [Sphingorhabdus lutea]